MKPENAKLGITCRSAIRQHWPFAAPLLLGCGLAHAVAGGAGGGGGGGGGTGGFSADSPEMLILEIILWILIDVPYPYNVLVLATPALVFLLFVLREWMTSSGLNKIPSSRSKGSSVALRKIGHQAKRSFLSFRTSPKPLPSPADIVKSRHDFDGDALIAKVRLAFPAIQQAWSAQDMTQVRRWISDGIWQRFNTQFEMMRLLGQRNIIRDLEIRRIFIDDTERDGAFDIVHVGIQFSARDDFISETFPELDQRGQVEMTEYWTFLRKRGVAAGDLYSSNRCPACGTALPSDMGEVARCASCQVVSTLGDYDWILSEITQADDYRNQDRQFAKEGRLTGRIRQALGLGDDLAVQLIEDQASNAFMQIMAARATRRPERLRRFVDDSLFACLSDGILQQASFVFNRLYLNNVTLIDFFRRAGRNNLVVAFKYTAQRVAVHDEKLEFIDRGLYARDEIMIISRDVGAGDHRGSVYAHVCPACGGPVGDTLEIRCQYCGEVINSTRYEWIVTALLPRKEYQSLISREKRALATGGVAMRPDPLFADRDYALNNILAILGSDGEISNDEMAFARKLARRMNYDPGRLTGLFELAKSRRVVLRLPHERESSERVLKMMNQAANVDRRITPAEQQLLDEIRRHANALVVEAGS